MNGYALTRSQNTLDEETELYLPRSRGLATNRQEKPTFDILKFQQGSEAFWSFFSIWFGSLFVLKSLPEIARQQVIIKLYLSSLGDNGVVKKL